MTVRQRLSLLRLLEKQEQYPEYLARLGIFVRLRQLTEKENETCLK